MDAFQTMVKYYNTCENKDTNYQIIEYILKHIDTINNMAITQIAEETYVSKPTITRFVRKFGYKDYDDFKKSIYNTYHKNFNSSFRLTDNQMYVLEKEPKKFLDEYADSICDAINDFKNYFDYTKIDFLIDEMMSKKCGIFAYNQPLNCAMEIQNDFFMKNKIIYVGESYSKQLEIAKSLTKNDLAIIMSNYGNYFSEYKEIKDILIQNNVPIILITLNYHSPQLLNFKDIIYLSSQPFTSVGSYPMKLFTEYLVRRLRVKYK